MDNLALYAKQAMSKKQRVWFVGDCALKEGVGVCYELGFADSNETGETLTDAYGFRNRAVMLPRTATKNFFAGVVAQDYDAAPSVLGQPIDIYIPGGAAKCLVAVSVTAGSDSDSDGHVQCQSEEHTIAGTHTAATITGKLLTQAGGDLSTYVLAGDVIFITAGTGVKPGGYTVATTPTTGIAVTLENSPGTYLAASADLAYVVIERAHASGTFYNASSSGVFIDCNSTYGKSCAHAMQSGTYVATNNLLLCQLEEGNDGTGLL